MLKRIFSGIVLALVILACRTAPAARAAEDRQPLTIVADGKSDYVIVLPDADPRGRTRKAADLLQSSLAEATGAKLPILKEADLKAGTPAIYLGATQAARSAGLPLADLKGWDCLLQVRGADLFLAGLDSDAGIKGRGEPEYLGTLKAVTTFLEDDAGVRFLLPGPNGVAIPKVARLTVPGDLKLFKRPNFSYVIGRAPEDIVYATANNYFCDDAVVKSYGGHSYYSAVPEKVYAKDHPEYFALLQGVRTSKGNHLCISNPDVQKLMVQEMLKQLDLGYGGVELSQTDGYRPCECAQCRAISPDPGERLWIVHRKLAEEVQKLRPGKKVMIISYDPTANPPKSFKTFPDNVMIEMCNYTPESFDQWAAFDLDKTVYVYNWGTYHSSGFGPKRTPRYAADQVKRFVQNRVKGIYLCGGFEDCGLEGPVFYVYGKMMGDPAASYEELFNDYCRAAYGNARAPMRAFFSAMYARLELYSSLNNPNFRTEMNAADAFWRAFPTPEDFYCYFFPARQVVEMEKDLERAKGRETDPRVLARIRLVEMEFAYVKNLAAIFQLYRAYLINPAWASFDPLAAEIDRRNALIDSWYDAKGVPKPLDGWPVLMSNAAKSYLKTGGYMYAILSAPVNWDTALLRKKMVLPGVGVKTLKAGPIAAFTLDADVGKPAWQAIPAQEMGEIGMGTVKNATTFKVAHDDKNLYFAFDCQVAAAEQLDVRPFGRDGAVWTAECVEIILDPFGTREKYYHLIFNPVANSFYDARYGFIEDPLDPRYHEEDVAWNGDWEYTAKIDKEKKRWTAEVKIPFAALGVAPPKPGTTWWMNLGRECLTPGTREQSELSLWSPNLEERSFTSLGALGELVFE